VCDLEKLVNEKASPGPLGAVGPKENKNLLGKVNLIDLPLLNLYPTNVDNWASS
jgi:hypothetical protein